ncbi:MAG: putative glycoside hydrolase [Bacillota bacterium]
MLRNSANSLRERMAAARNFALYYGSESLEALAGFDLVILEPDACFEADIQGLRASGALVCGYLSVLEVDGLVGLRQIQPTDYLMFGGERKRNPRSSNWVMDPRSEHWVQVVLQRAERQILGKGCDGIFLDTIGDVEDPDLPKSLAAQLIPASALLVRRIREHFPNALLIQNWGLDFLYRLTVPYLDGLCWENFPLKWPEDPWSLSKLGELERVSRKTGARVLLLAQANGLMSTGSSAWEDAEETQLKAARYGFLFYAAPGSYTTGVNTCFCGSG